MLNSFLGLQLGVDLGRCSSCSDFHIVSFCGKRKTFEAGLLAIPAAAAGSTEPDFLESSAPGLKGSRLRGLRVRVDSGCREEGDRERRSNREARRGSGSVWSKRERLARRSSSAMIGDGYEGRGGLAVTGRRNHIKMVQNKPKRKALDVQKQQKGLVELRGSAQWALVQQPAPPEHFFSLRYGVWRNGESQGRFSQGASRGW